MCIILATEEARGTTYAYTLVSDHVTFEAVILTINKDIASVSICKRFFKPFHSKLVVGVERVRPLVAHVKLKKTQ
jgi:hypothetical protein